MTVTDRRAAPPVEASVRLAGVSKVFGRGGSAVRALDQVSLEVAPGEFACLVGASGCGKSTLLSLVAGLEQPTSGEVSADGRRVVVLSSRPGRVIAEFAVPIARPRRIDSAPVAELAARVTDRLREEMSPDGR